MMDTKEIFANKILNLKGILYVAGNGGSAELSNHLACDFMKIGIKTISLVSNNSLITMIANDYGYETIFEYQLRVLLKPDDMVLLISSSGNSSNVVKAAIIAKEKGVPVLSLTGFSGGKLKEVSFINHHVDINDYGLVECMHANFFHELTNKMRETINANA